MAKTFGDIKRVESLDKSLSPMVYMFDRKFSFDDISISLLQPKKRSYILFNMEIYRTEEARITDHESSIPLIIDLLVSDLTPTLQTYWDGKVSGVQQSIEKRINRRLKAQFTWIDRVRISNVRIQN